MKQTPVHDNHNPDLLKVIPAESKFLVEVGCSSGALAREFKKISPSCDYLGIEIDSDYASLAKRYCDHTQVLNIEEADDEFFEDNSFRDCWIFGDTLEHFKDPWKILKKIRHVIPSNGCVVSCIPNAQHWSVQARLNIGNFRYEDSGLLDRTHLRWFTKTTMIEMFDEAGFTITGGLSRIFDEPHRQAFLPIIGEMAKLSGLDPEVAIADCIPLQYVIKAIPK